jgi:FecR-like protein
MNDVNAKRFKLSSRGLMLTLVSAAFASPSLANTGRVDFTIGNVNLTNAQGRVQPLTKGAEVRSGDKVTSGSDGRAQIRFSDGAYVSLQPNTEFDIKEYRYNGKTDGTESAIFGLFKGALRTVTGLVGRVNRNKYQITTPTATIGIRGTGGLISVGGDGSTLVTGTSGIWSLTNNGGTLDIPAGTAGFAGSNRNVPPQPSIQGPVVPPPQSPPQRGFVQGDVVNAQGTLVALAPPLQSGPGYAVAAAEGSSASSSTTLASSSNAVFDQTGRLVQFTTGAGTFNNAGNQAEFGTFGGVIAWGRWTGNALKNGVLGATYSDNEGLHYVVGLPTPAASLPTGMTFTYNMIGATSPTFSDGRTVPGTFSGTLVGDFISGKVGLDFAAAMPTKTYAFTTSGFTLGGLNPNSPITITTSTSTFSGSIFNPGACSCTASVSGFFAGSGATHAGMAYQISDPSIGTTTVSGTAAFQR